MLMVMTYRRLLPVAAAAAALIAPAAAHADGPWSAPLPVPGSQDATGGAPAMLLTRTRGGAVGVDTPGSFPGISLQRSVLVGSAVNAKAPGPLASWPGGRNLDPTFGSFAAADRLIYAGSNGDSRVLIGTATGPQGDWTTSLRGPTTSGSKIATAAAAHGGTAAVFGTFQTGGGSVYLVRQPGTSKLQPTQRLSTARGGIHSVAVAVNASGDILAAWDRAGHVEARFWYASSKRLGPVQELGRADVAGFMTVALGADRRAIVAWVDQRVNEGGAASGKVMATARSASRGFLAPTQLDTYGVNMLAGGIGIKAGYTGTGVGLIAFSGNAAIRWARVDSRVIGAPADLAPVPAGTGRFGLADLATSPTSDRAVATWIAPGTGDREQGQAAVWAPNATSFGPVETLTGEHGSVSGLRAAFDYAANTVVTAWTAGDAGATPASQVEVATRESF
jgi:hypothetical protein